MKRILSVSLIIFFFWGIRDLSAQSGTVATDGVYVPRLTTAARNAIASPTNGQLIFNSDENCFNVYQNGSWQKLCGFDVPSTSSGIWTQKANFGGTARSAAVGFSIGSKGYIGTGNVYPSGSQNDFWEYDPSTDAWTQKANFGGVARVNAVGFSINNKGYIGTGSSGGTNLLKDFWEYDPIANTWTQKAAFGGTIRSNAAGFSIGSKGYIGTGFAIASEVDPGGETKDFWEYNPSTNTWTQKADFGGVIRSGAVGFSIGDKGYLGTGVNIAPPTAFPPYELYNDFWEYNPTTDVWTQKANFFAACTGAVGFSVGNKGYIGTGFYDLEVLKKDFKEYDPTTNTWIQKADFGGTIRSGAVGFSIGSKGYLGTGAGSSASDKKNDFWEFNPIDTSKEITMQGNTFNGANQLVKLDGAGSFPGDLTVTGNLTVGGQLFPSENFIAPTLSNNWINYDVPNGYAAAGYFKDKESIVHLKGLIKNGTTVNGTIIFTLPLGYRPAGVQVFTVSNSGASLARIYISVDGTVRISSGGNTYLSLNGISFRAN